MHSRYPSSAASVVTEQIIIKHHFLDTVRAIIPFLLPLLFFLPIFPILLVIHIDGSLFDDRFLTEESLLADPDLHFYFVLHWYSSSNNP